ncbi:hypothetical protein SCACP_16420 [Sporomusa carbonis]|uniref:DUF6115 domain-containing protein n=1 Tax=Sporomusa carbonis TaxID=3076075 RepID=UPI003A6FD254
MLSGVIVSVLVILLLAFFLIYKKEMIIKMFALNVSTPANEFAQQLEQTADSVIKRLEDEAAHLELLLDEAEAKIAMLGQQLECANRIIEQLTGLENKQDTVEQSRETIKAVDTRNLPAIVTETDKTKSLNIIEKKLPGAVAKKPIIGEKHRLIIAMAEQGYTVTEIAKATGMGRGEIMLLLQLNNK